MASTGLRPLLYPAALDLINSSIESDLLATPETALPLLRRWELDPGRPPTAHELTSLRQLRELLSRLTDTVTAGRLLDEDELEALNEELAGAPVTASLGVHRGTYALTMTPAAPTWLGTARRELAGSFSSMLLLATPTRVKRCGNPRCRRAFWDTTRSRTRRWCDGRRCGNAARQRRFRERHAAA